MAEKKLPLPPRNTKNLLYSCLLIVISIFAISTWYYLDMFDGSFSEESEVWGHFGDYFNVFIGFANLLIVSLLTWGIFDIQNANDNWKEFQKQEEYEAQKLKYFENLIRKSKSFSNKTVDGLRKFSDEIDNDPEEIPLLRAASAAEIKRMVQTIDQEGLFHAYHNKIGTEGSLEIFEGFNVVYENYVEQLKDIEAMVANNFSRRNDLVNLIKQIIDEAASLMTIEKSHGRHGSELFSFLNDIILDYYKGVEAHPNRTFGFQKIVFAPILKCFQIDNKYLNQDYKKIIELTMKANKSIVPIQENNKSLAERARLIATNIEEVVTNLEPYIEALQTFNRSSRG